jgi:hypothetical protein
MSRGPLRTLFSVLILALALATAVPAPSAAAGSRRGDPGNPGRSLTDFIPQWIVSLFEKIGLHGDPNGAGGTVTTSGDGGDTGWGIDPNG